MLHPLLAFVAVFFLFATPALAEPAPTRSADASEQWIEVHRETGLWSRADGAAGLFRKAEPGTRFKVASPQDGPRLYVFDPIEKNYAFVDADDVGPIASYRVSVRRDGQAERPVAAGPKREGASRSDRSDRSDATDGPSPQNVFWSGTAHVTMYTCVELGGCNHTASGLWPYEGVVAVDPRVIPLGSTVWIEGLGTFLAADTGSAIHGNRIDVYVHDYGRARAWGVHYLQAAAYR